METRDERHHVRPRRCVDRTGEFDELEWECERNGDFDDVDDAAWESACERLENELRQGDVDR